MAYKRCVAFLSGIWGICSFRFQHLNGWLQGGTRFTVLNWSHFIPNPVFVFSLSLSMFRESNVLKQPRKPAGNQRHHQKATVEFHSDGGIGFDCLLFQLPAGGRLRVGFRPVI